MSVEIRPANQNHDTDRTWTFGGATVGPGGIGMTANGGSVTQLSSKSTLVTLNKACGKITMHAAALGASTSVVFQFNNSTIAATDVVVFSVASAGTQGAYFVQAAAIGAGGCYVHLRNVSAGSLSEAVVLNYMVHKAVAA